MPNSYIGKMATILWLQPLWAHRDKIPQYCNSTWKPMSESSSAIKRYGSRFSDKLCPNTCCLFFLDAYCVGKHQILRKSSNFHKIPLVNHWIFRKISYLCPRIEAFFAYCKIQKRAEVRSFPYCYLYNIGKRPTSWFSIKVQFRASYIFYLSCFLFPMFRFLRFLFYILSVYFIRYQYRTYSYFSVILLNEEMLRIWIFKPLTGE